MSLPCHAVENVQNPSTMVSWWSKTGNVKLIERDSTLLICLAESFLALGAP